MCSRSSIKSFGSSDLQFLHKIWYLMNRNQCCNIRNGYKMILERSFAIWFNYGIIGNLKIFPILAGLMIAHSSLFHANSNKKNNIAKVTINTCGKRSQEIQLTTNMKLDSFGWMLSSLKAKRCGNVQ